MKNKYFWPNRAGVVFLILFLAICGIAFFIVVHNSQPGDDIHFVITLLLLVLSPCALLILLIIISFVKVTDNTLIYYKYGFLRYEIKLTDITEWGSYNTCDRSDWFLYITSVPVSLLRQGDVINKNVLKFKNRKKFILLNYDKGLLEFLDNSFPDKKRKLYRYPDEYYRQE